MNKKTKNMRQALERMAGAMGVDLVKDGKLWKSSAFAGRKNTKTALGFLADTLRRKGMAGPEYTERERIKNEVVRWYGSIPMTGLPDWCRGSLYWLHLDPPVRVAVQARRRKASVKAAKTVKRMRARRAEVAAHA